MIPSLKTDKRGLITSKTRAVLGEFFQLGLEFELPGFSQWRRHFDVHFKLLTYHKTMQSQWTIAITFPVVLIMFLFDY